MNKYMLSAAAIVVASSFSMPTVASGNGPWGGKYCNGDVCDLKIKAEVEEKCYCMFDDGDSIDLGKLNAYHQTTSSPKKLKIHCNTSKADVQVKTLFSGLKGHIFERDHVEYTITGGDTDYQTASNWPLMWKPFASNLKDDYLNITIETDKFDFKKVKPGKKYDVAYFKVTPVSYSHK